MVANPQPGNIQPDLTSLPGYQTFGGYLKTKHQQLGVTQAYVVSSCLVEQGVYLSEASYGFLVRNRRAPEVEEIVPLFRMLIKLHEDKHQPLIGVAEARAFFKLAREKIESKKKRKPDLTDEEWQTLEQQILSLANMRERFLHLVEQPSLSFVEPANSRRRQALFDMLRSDTSHLLERDEWIGAVAVYLNHDPVIKVSVIQAGMGEGKSSALTLLSKKLAEREDLFLVPYRFLHSETMTADDHLDEFLATLLSDLTLRTADETKQRPLSERINQILKVVGSFEKKVVLLVDDAQEVFPTADSWSLCWHEFFERFMNEPLHATLYLMTRTWPGWDGRKRDYLREEDLPNLSVEAGVCLWKRQGFDDVGDDLLRRVCLRAGTNPQAIEMLSYQHRRRSFARSWGRGFVQEQQKRNLNTISLEALLESESLFSNNLDKTSREILQQVFSNRLSGDTMKLLECLALSPLGIPFSLLVEQFDHAEDSFEDLVKASFADLAVAVAGRATVVPLVREAVVQSLPVQRRIEVEQQVTAFYARWLTNLQDFRDDAEKAALIAEMVVRYVRSRQLLKAAELFISFGWLCTLFSQVARIQRVFEEVVREERGKDLGAAYEVGKQLFLYHTTIRLGKEVPGPERERLYQEIFDKVVNGEVSLQPHTEIDVLHSMMLRYLRLEFFIEAERMFDETLERLHRSGLATSDVYASYLHSKSRLLARWSEAEKRSGRLDEAQRLRLACVETLRECVSQWRQCLKRALPLQEIHATFQLARGLNDYAYRLRLISSLGEAEEAIEECIRLRRSPSHPDNYLAIALSESSQILAAQGKIWRALERSSEAVPIMEKAVEEGRSSASELGMLLKERADIYMQQARLQEALPLLERTVILVGEKKSRRTFREAAEEQIKEIKFSLTTAGSYKLDKQWFGRFRDLASFDDFAWLEPAGPFNDDEQAEWDGLYPQRGEEEVLNRLNVLLLRSRQREFARCQEQHCTPHLWYPLVPLAEVGQRIVGFEKLLRDIETQETHALVRALYVAVINEHITILRQCEATVQDDQETVWKGHLALYGKPEEHEMRIALQPLCAMLLRGRKHSQAGSVAQELLSRLQSWGLSPRELAEIPPLVPKLEATGGKLQGSQKQMFSHEVVRRFFQDVLSKEYHVEDWHVTIAPSSDHAYVDASQKTVFLPPRPLSLEKVRELLAEEIEVHAYRSLSGQHSPLALLSLGLASYSATEEGLANHYIQQVSLQVSGKARSKPWISTLCIGLVTGVMVPQHSFLELCDFLEKVSLVNFLRREADELQEDVLTDARDEAWTRAARIFRGVPNLDQGGCCSLRDRVYLRGYMDVLRYLEHGEEGRLLVGKIKIDDLDAMEELSILKPCYPRRYLALTSDLSEYLELYK
jgi:tetratricopeptide (TPR) repeat protein